jgi:uncharacterized protein
MKELFVFVVGIVVGSINSVGGGGMLLGFPVLLAAGLPAIVANATGKLAVLPGQLTSAYGYRKFLRALPRSYLLLLIPAAIGGAVGAELLKRTTWSQFEGIVPYLVLIAVALFALEPMLEREFRHTKKRRKAVLPLGVIAICMLVVSTYAGYFGAGFGFVMLSVFGLSKLQSIHHMNLLKNLVGAATVLATIVVLLPSSLIDWKLGIFMAAGNGIGGYITARLAPRLPTSVVRGIVICLGVLTAAYFLLHD